MSDNADQQLILRLRAGDTAAFDAIVLLYGERLQEYAYRMLRQIDRAEDVVQDVFVWLFEHRTTLDIRGTLRSYLYGAVRHHALTQLRQIRLEEQYATEFLADALPPAMGAAATAPDVALERQELAAILAQALGTLSPRVRQVALLRWRDKLRRTEIADILGVTVPTVNNQLTTAARQLRRWLAEHASGIGE